jgi:hypothetical protein
MCRRASHCSGLKAGIRASAVRSRAHPPGDAATGQAACPVHQPG